MFDAGALGCGRRVGRSAGSRRAARVYVRAGELPPRRRQRVGPGGHQPSAVDGRPVVGWPTARAPSCRSATQRCGLRRRTSISVVNFDDRIAQFEVTQGAVHLHVRDAREQRLDRDRHAQSRVHGSAAPAIIGSTSPRDGDATSVAVNPRSRRKCSARRTLIVIAAGNALSLSRHRSRRSINPSPSRAATRSMHGPRSACSSRNARQRALRLARHDRLCGSRRERRHGATIPNVRRRLGADDGSPPTGRRIAMAIGRGSIRGAGPGSTMRRGASRRSTTGAGRSSRAAGAGFRVRARCAPSTRRRSSPSSAATTFALRCRSARAAASAGSRSAPGDVYRPAYTASREYFTRVNVTNTVVNVTNVTNIYNNPTRTNIRYANANNVNAVTAVPTQAFVDARPVQRAAVKVDARAHATGAGRRPRRGGARQGQHRRRGSRPRRRGRRHRDGTHGDREAGAAAGAAVDRAARGSAEASARQAARRRRAA